MEPIWLEWSDGRGPQRLALTGPVTIGRTPGNTIPIDEPGVSRSHCRVTVARGQVHVDARGSTNGIRVGGKRVESATLRLGEQFQVGDVVFRVVRATSLATFPTARRPSPVAFVIGVASAAAILLAGAFAVVRSLTNKGDSPADSERFVSEALASIGIEQLGKPPQAVLDSWPPPSGSQLASVLRTTSSGFDLVESRWTSPRGTNELTEWYQRNATSTGHCPELSAIADATATTRVQCDDLHTSVVEIRDSGSVREIVLTYMERKP